MYVLSLRFLKRDAYVREETFKSAVAGNAAVELYVDERTLDVGALAALVFSVVALRNALPGTPPIAVTADLAIFLWLRFALLSACRCLSPLGSNAAQELNMFALFRRFVAIACAAVAVAVSAVPCAAAVRTPLPLTAVAKLRAALQGDIDAYLRDRSATEHLSSLSLTVSLGRDLPAISVTAGTTRYGAGARVTPANLYQIGSITKAFTAVAVLQLEARGRLSIDAPIGTYLPQYPAYTKLTLRQLLHMTSGLETYDNLPVWYANYVKDPKQYRSADSLIRLVYPKRRFPAGARYYYSNTGYLLAQEIVAARSGSRSFEKEIARIIASVGLKNTYYSSHLYGPSIAQRVVAGYYENDDPGFAGFLGRDTRKDSLSWAQGAGAIVSTPADITAWARELYTGTKLLPPLQRRELMGLVSTKSALPLKEPTAVDSAGFGLGVAKRFNPRLGTFWFYQGETLGFRAAHLYFPQRDLVVSIFANSRPTETKSRLPSLFATIDSSIRAAYR